MVRRSKNYSRKKVASAYKEAEKRGYKSGITYEKCNFAQLVPGTVLFSGYKNLTFRKCNLVNCDLPEDSIIEDCNTAQISYCTWLHPKWNAEIPDCPVDCEHTIGKRNIKIDEKVTISQCIRKDKVL